ncbi:hypothetical protein [Methyloversatilis thermotolerans]|uniref:hypothetical protein n=1 Tax=Methyloversatilis thermotolerans TaxID=1346290 RepID=UPI00039D8433
MSRVRSTFRLVAPAALLALAAAGVSATQPEGGRFRALVELDNGWPRACGSAVAVAGWDIRIVRERQGDEVLARVEVRPPPGNPALPVLARLEIEQFHPAILLVPRDGLLALPGFDSDNKVDWATLMRNFMFFGGTLVLGQVGGDIELPFRGPAPRDVTGQYLNCSGDLAAPLRNGS